MPCYLFTYHAYRSWMPDRPRGFVKEGEGVQPPDPQLADAYRRAAKHPPVWFEAGDQRALIERAQAVCGEKAWRLHAAASEPTHLHVLISWADDQRWKAVRGRVKNLLSLHRSRRSGRTGRPWFSDGASRRRIRDREHFDYHMQQYLPKHRGVKWFEDGRGWC